MSATAPVNETLLRENIDIYNIKVGEAKPAWIREFIPNDPKDYTLEVYGGIKYLFTNESEWFFNELPT